MGGDRPGPFLREAGPSFNPRPRMGGDSCIWTAVLLFNMFQSTPRMGGDSDRQGLHLHGRSFNPRPRMGGDWQEGRAGPRHDPVSIHAPVWGATRRLWQ